MPPLLSYDPTGASFSPVSPAQYAQLTAAMKSHPGVSKLTDNSCEVQGVDFAWQFFAVNSTVHVQITAKHGLFVSHVPNATIFDKLRDEFFNTL